MRLFSWSIFFPLFLITLVFPAVSVIKAGNVDLANKQSAQSKEPAKKILRAEDFSDYRLRRGSALEDVSFAIEISSKLPPYLFRLIPDRAAGRILDSQRVGRIEISRLGAPDLLQTIEVTSEADVSLFTSNFHARDVNFDGCLDIMVLSDHSAKSLTFNYWLFDRGSGRFITNRLTRQLGRLTANAFDWNPESRTVHLGFLLNDQARIGETYRLENDRLVLIGIEETRKDCDDNFRHVSIKIIDGKREGKDILTLEPCKQITQNIAKGQAHHYDVELKAGQSLRIEIWGDMCLLTTLFGPDGVKRTVVENTCEGELKYLSWTAERSGIYRIQVRSSQKKRTAGRYYLTLEEPRPARPNNDQ